MGVTAKDVAKEARVSTATVSFVVNNKKNVDPETRQRVLDAIKKTGYQPNTAAKNLRQKRTKTIGVLVEDIMGFSVPPIMYGISEYTEKHGYHILLNDLHLLESIYNKYDQIYQQKSKINEAISTLLYGDRVDAIIYVGLFDRDITGVLTGIKKPLVLAYSTSADQGAHCVTYDNEGISAEVIRYLLQKGHERIALITGPENSYPASMRMRGVQQAFAEAGIVLRQDHIKVGDWEYSSGYVAMTELLELQTRPTAVFAMNDYMAAGAITAIWDSGLCVPDDISIIGFDNREISYYIRPRLTTIEIDLKEVGRAAAEMVLLQIQGKQVEQRNLVVPSRIIERETIKTLKP